MADHYTYIHPSGQRDISASPATLLQLKIPYGFEGYPVMTQFGMNGDHKNADSAQTSYNLPDQDTSTTPSPPSLITSTDGAEVAWPSSLLPDSPHIALPSSNSTSNQPQPRRSRKEKFRIELAPNQPPTSQGRPRARVFVACVQWYAPFPSSVVWQCPLAFSLAVAARFVVTARSQCVTIVHSATGTSSALTIPYRSAVDRIGSREHALVAQGHRKTENRGAGDAIPPRQSSKLLVVGHVTLGGRASIPNLRQSIPWEIRLSSSIRNRAVFGPMDKNLTDLKP
jgi:hypothetical protein